MRRSVKRENEYGDLLKGDISTEISGYEYGDLRIRLRRSVKRGYKYGDLVI